MSEIYNLLINNLACNYLTHKILMHTIDPRDLCTRKSRLNKIVNKYSSEICVQQYGDPIQEMMMCRNVHGVDRHDKLRITFKR